MTNKEILFFREQVNNSSYYLEFGSGNSTSVAIRYSNIRHITIVESDFYFWQNLVYSDTLLHKSVLEGRLTPLLVNIGPIKMWGYPIDDSCRERWPEYAEAPFKGLNSYDLILVDGRFRIACTLFACLYAIPTVRIMIHDFYNRPRYRIVLLFLIEIKRVDTFGLFIIKPNIDKNLAKKIIQLYKYAPDC